MTKVYDKSHQQSTMMMKRFLQPITVVLLTMALMTNLGCSKEDGYARDITDKEGNVYKTIRLGDQIWMAENLRALKYHDESDIPSVRVYADKEENAKEYGRLYTWDAVMRGGADKDGNVQGPCPRGWRVPTDNDWKELEEYIGVPSGELNNIAWRGTIEGGMLKETGTEFWEAPNTEASNTTLFAAKGGGHYNVGLGYTGWHLQALFWTATQAQPTSAWNRTLRSAGGEIGRYEANTDQMLSVRCIKN